ncbi:hypothetical protein FHETE_8292 [Fusarium heterosporum]|uniref:BZIP domain-containing protein n=1 Tax=Fusarium heterosporum TaxID=42747 RepID=A0A8H5WGH7_FUSHE|nr:hypothetical protein FHETE_8292 [Fusarium heterosporum]
MSNNIFRMFNPGAPKQDPVEKRRAQLRRAQQSYRGRKDRYARTLEDELAKSRSHEAELMRECEQLRSSLKAAVDQLSQHGIAFSTDFQAKDLDYNAGNWPMSNTTGSSTGVTPEFLGNDLNQAVEIMPSPQLITPESFGDFYDSPGSPQGPILFSSRGLENSQVCEVDQVVAGIEFVLKIEEPCLGHFHGDPEKPFEPANHAMTASAHLVAECNHTSPTSNSPPPLSPGFGNIPKGMLDRLLTLAPDLSDEGDLTPVQAWNSIRSRPNFGGFNIRSLGLLATKLKTVAKCHGFGAVVKQSVFEGLVYDTLESGRPF